MAASFIIKRAFLLHWAIAAFFSWSASSTSWYEKACTSTRNDVYSVAGVNEMAVNLTVTCDKDRAHLTAISDSLHVTSIRLAQGCSNQGGLNQSNFTEDEITYSSLIEEYYPDLYPQPLNQLEQSDLECTYYGCYVGDPYSYARSRYYFTFPTVTCTFSQLSTSPIILPSPSSFRGQSSEYYRTSVTLSESIDERVSKDRSYFTSEKQTSTRHLLATSSIMSLKRLLVTSYDQSRLIPTSSSIVKHHELNTLTLSASVSSYSLSTTNNPSSSENTSILLWLLPSIIIALIVTVLFLIMIVCLLNSIRCGYSKDNMTIYKVEDIFDVDFMPVHTLKPTINKTFSSLSISTKLDQLSCKSCSKSSLTVNMTDSMDQDQSSHDKIMDYLKPSESDNNSSFDLGSNKDFASAQNLSDPIHSVKDTVHVLEQEHCLSSHQEYITAGVCKTETTMPNNKSEAQQQQLCSGFLLLDQNSENSFLCDGSFPIHQDYITDTYTGRSEAKLPTSIASEAGKQDPDFELLLDQYSDHSFSCDALLDLDLKTESSELSPEQVAGTSASSLHSLAENEDSSTLSLENKQTETRFNSSGSHALQLNSGYVPNIPNNVVDKMGFNQPAYEEESPNLTDAYYGEEMNIGDLPKIQQRDHTDGGYVYNDQGQSGGINGNKHQPAEIEGIVVEDLDTLNVLSLMQVDIDYDDINI